MLKLRQKVYMKHFYAWNFFVFQMVGPKTHIFVAMILSDVVLIDQRLLFHSHLT